MVLKAYHCLGQSCPITQSSQLFHNHDSHLIEDMMAKNHFNPKKIHANGSHRIGSIKPDMAGQQIRVSHHSNMRVGITQLSCHRSL